jgi:hypothetical protein
MASSATSPPGRSPTTRPGGGWNTGHGKSYLNWNRQRHGVSIERIRRDRVLHEALTARADPLHLALVFGLSRTTASRYTLIACDLLADQDAGAQHDQASVMSAKS